MTDAPKRLSEEGVDTEIDKRLDQLGVRGGYAAAQADLDALADLGMSYDDVVRVLEDEGVSKFEASWRDLPPTVSTALASFATANPTANPTATGSDGEPR